MTEKRDKIKNPEAIARGSSQNAFHMEADRSARGMSLMLSGIIGITDISNESIVLNSHSCRVFVFGARLSVCIYENNAVEIRGRIEEIRFSYGKKQK